MLHQKKLVTVLLALVLAFGLTACGGNGTDDVSKYNDAVDIEFSKGIIEDISKFGDDADTGNRSAGSPAEKETMEYIKGKMEEIGLENITVDKADSDGWTYKGANVTFKNEKGEDQKVILGGYQTTLQAKDEKVSLVYVNQGTADDYADLDVEGKLVLLELNPDEDWWINYPAYQAKLKGAKAVLALTVMAEKIPDRINSNDICGPADAPAFGISQNDSEALQAAIKKNNGEIEVILNADSKVTEDTGTNNVWGEIPGKSDETILFLAHYDGYYHSYYDDAFGVGTILGMAKAFKESGYVPDKTLRFITHGAEEWGKTGAETDWAVGSYQQIVNVHPEWAESAFALVNIDSGYMLEGTKSFEVCMAEELKEYMGTFIENYDSGDVDVAVYDGVPMTGTEDFGYNAMGILTMSNESEKGDEKYFGSMYHSSKDTLEEGGFADDTYTTMNEFYGAAVISLDQMAAKPMNLESRFTALRDSIDTDIADADGLEAQTSETMASARDLDAKVAELNNQYEEAFKGDNETKASELKDQAATLNKSTYGLYKLIQDDLLKLNRWMEAQYPHEVPQTNIKSLNAAIDSLKDGNGEDALDSLYEIESVYYASAFDKATCDYFLSELDKGTKGTWAEGRLVGDPCDAGDVVRSLMVKVDEKSTDFDSEITALQQLVDDQTTTLKAQIKDETDNLVKIQKKIDEITATF